MLASVACGVVDVELSLVAELDVTKSNKVNYPRGFLPKLTVEEVLWRALVKYRLLEGLRLLVILIPRKFHYY